MALPASVPVGTVIGRWWDTDGSDSVGTIVFLARELVEVPDLPQGVVLPIRYPVDVTAGVLNVALPAGFYDVSVRLSELYKDHKTVEVVAGQVLNLPDAIGVVPVEDLVTPVRSVNGVFPDSAGNITISGGGGGAVSSVFGRTGAVVAQNGDYTKTQVGLGNVDNTSDAAKPLSSAAVSALAGKENVGVASTLLSQHVAAADPHTQYALETSLATVATSGSFIDLSNKPSIPPKIGEHRRYLSDATPNPYYEVPDTGGSWAVFAAPGTLVLPASVGDRIVVDLQLLTRGIGDWLVDLAVTTSGTIKRYLSSGSATPTNAGFPGGYPFTQGSLEFQPVYGSGGFTVTSDDLFGGNVTLSAVVKSTTNTGRFYASSNFTSQWTMRNIGPT